MDVIKDRQATLWELINRAYAILYVAHQKDWAGLDNPAVLRLQNDVNLFCLEFAIDYEVERAVWLEAAEKQIKEEENAKR
jgi:hypothetical protein